MDTGVPDGTEAEDLSEPCLGEGNTNDSILHAFSDSKEYVAAQLGQLPAQLLEHAVGNLQPRVCQRPWGLSTRAAQVLVEPDPSLILPQSGVGGMKAPQVTRAFKCCGNTLNRSGCCLSPGGVAISISLSRGHLLSCAGWLCMVLPAGWFNVIL